MAAPTPVRRPERLSTLRNAKPTLEYTTPRARAKAPRTCCSTPDIQDYDGKRVCLSCGDVQNESNIVSDVTFGESSTGAAVVQGAYVAEGQRHAKSMGSAFRRVGGGSESREQTEYNGRDELRKLSAALNISQAIEDQAFNIYRLAATNNFIQGRRTRSVAAACLYVACRRNENNTILLMDLAEKIQMNVFKLGDVYKELMKDLWLGEFVSSCSAPAIEPEHLIEKFTRKLEFGDKWLAVATDAAKILKRMKRDWMVEGRQPAGLCGACIILAARMNNFRRTVREVVYVVKVADATIAERIQEFSRTQGGRLTVKRFREIGADLKSNMLPPSIYKRQALERKRKKWDVVDEQQTIAGENAPEDQPRPSQAPRIDSDGFAIPDRPVQNQIPIDPHLLAAAEFAHSELEVGFSIPNEEREQEPQKKRRGRPKKKKVLPRPREEDLILEEAIEYEIEEVLNDPQVQANVDDDMIEKSTLKAKALADQLRGPSVVLDDQEIGEDEFEDDPEVMFCQLSPAEIAIKERIWVTENEEWMRQQQTKLLKKALEEASGTRRKPQRRRKRGRLGDKSVLDGASPDAGTGEAVQLMLQKRGKADFSKHINYENIKRIYNSSGAAREQSEPRITDFTAGDSHRQPLRPTAVMVPTPPATQTSQPASSVAAPSEDTLAQTAAREQDERVIEEQEDVEEIDDDDEGSRPVHDALRQLGVEDDFDVDDNDHDGYDDSEAQAVYDGDAYDE